MTGDGEVVPSLTRIGRWSARFLGQRRMTRWHLVESVVADRAVMRCGREMHEQGAAGEMRLLAVQVGRSWVDREKCKKCGG